MLSREAQIKISNILISLSETERDVEISRQVLTENKDYNSYQIFCYLDSDKKNNINELDIFNYLKRKNISLTEIEAKLVILYYDQDIDKVLNFNEFLNLIESKSSPKKENKKIEGELCFSIDYELTKLLEKEIIYARRILNLFEDIKGFSDLNIHDIFHIIKGNDKNNCILQKNIINFLNKNFASFIDQDIDLVFKRIDLNKDNIIDLCEFHLFFGFPNCGYNCPFNGCKNCGIKCCPSCKIDGPCPIHKLRNKNNNNNFKKENDMKKKVYMTNYTNPQNKNNNINNSSKIAYNENIINSNEYCSNRVNNVFNKGKPKISQNIELKLSPEIENVPNKLCLSNIYNINNNISQSNNCNNSDINNDNKIYKNDSYYLNNSKYNNINTFGKNYLKNNNNLTSKYYDYINNSQNNFNNIPLNNNIKYKENNENINIINSFEKKRNDNKDKNKNKNEYEEGQFIDYLREAMLQESKIEQIKIQLSLRSDFNCEKIFRLFQLEGIGFLSKNDLILGFHKFDIYPNDLDINLLLKRYDLKKQGIINYTNFFELIVPFSKYHRIMIEKRNINSEKENILTKNNELSLETINRIKKLFVEIFNGEFILNRMKETFTNLKIKFSDIFKLMDPKGEGYFGEKELYNFLQKNGIFTSNNDCDLLFLRLDKLRNGKIDFKEMCEEIEGIYQ